MIQKNLLALLALILVQPAFANTVQSVFTTQSIKSTELRQEIIDTLLQEYPCIENFGIKEKSTTVKEVIVDQGKTDYFYESTFTIIGYFDKYHPSQVDVVVNSALYYGQNPAIKWTEVKNVKTEFAVYCE